MGLLPTTGDDLDLVRFQIATQPGYTHKLDIDQQRVRGTTDERDAVLQAVYLILNVERYAYPIYYRNYGSELSDLIGKPKDYAMSEMKRRITEALLQDDRIGRRSWPAWGWPMCPMSAATPSRACWTAPGPTASASTS